MDILLHLQPVELATVGTEALLMLHPSSTVAAQIGRTARLHGIPTHHTSQERMAALVGEDRDAEKGVPVAIAIAGCLPHTSTIDAIKGVCGGEDPLQLGRGFLEVLDSAGAATNQNHTGTQIQHFLSS